MIKIIVDKKKIKKIEDIHWEWFVQKKKKVLDDAISLKSITINDKKRTTIISINNKLIVFLKEFNNDKLLKKIILGRVYDNDTIGSITKIVDKFLYKFPDFFEHILKFEISDFGKQLDYLKRETNETLRDVELEKEKKRIKNIIYKFPKRYNYLIALVNNIYLTKNRKNRYSDLENAVRGFEKNEAFHLVLENIFDYNLFIGQNKIIYNSETVKWGAYELLKELNVVTCPYCNRQMIYTYEGENGRARADIDHFYPKSKYPFLSVSLYNFIPSCHSCNSSCKRDKDFYINNCIYPYGDEFGEFAKFKTDFYSKGEKGKEYDIDYLLGNSENFDIKIETNNKKIKEYIIEETRNTEVRNLSERYILYQNKIKNSKEIFHLEQLYNFHKDYVMELIKKSIIYNKTRIQELLSEYPQLFKTEEDVVELIVSNYIKYEELGKRPLAKLTKDICEELGLIR